MIFRRYHISDCPERDESCLDDAIQEAMNDRFVRTYTQCECCETYIPRDEAESNRWFDTLCPDCLTARPCDSCGTPLLLHRLIQLDDEYYCSTCMTAILNHSGTSVPKNDTL